MTRKKTNDEFVQDLMNYSRRGALIQLFVIDALNKFSASVIEADESGHLAEKMKSNPLVSAEAWADCAREVREKMIAQYGSD